MTINRAPFDALVDDDGTNLTGTVWNKAAISGVILDPVDAALAVSGLPAGGVKGDLLIKDPAVPTVGAKWAPLKWTSIGYGGTGTVHNFDPGIVGDTTIVLSANVTITGFKPAVVPWEGQRLLCVMANATAMTFQHENAGSLANYQIRIAPTPTTYTGYWAYALFQYFVVGGTGCWLNIGGKNGF